MADRRFVAGGGNDDVKKFYKKLVDRARYVGVRSFLTGSFAEVPISSITRDYFDINLDEIDTDYMFYFDTQLVFPLEKPIPKLYNGQVLRNGPKSSHSGYTELYNETDNSLFLPINTAVIHADNISLLHGPAVQ